jgi:anti-sigma regulatory factor (Ser/Thr protein kinase)
MNTFSIEEQGQEHWKTAESVTRDRQWGVLDRTSEEATGLLYRSILRLFCSRNHIDDDTTCDSALIAGELLSNAHRYGLGESIHFEHNIKFTMHETWLELNFCYETDEFCTCRPMPDIELLLESDSTEFDGLAVGSRGIPLIRSLSDESRWDFELKPGFVVFTSTLALKRMLE